MARRTILTCDLCKRSHGECLDDAPEVRNYRICGRSVDICSRCRLAAKISDVFAELDRLPRVPCDCGRFSALAQAQLSGASTDVYTARESK